MNDSRNSDFSFSRDQMRETLRAAPLFAGFEDGVLEQFLALATPRVYEAGDVLFVEMQEGDEIFMILRGEVSIELALANADSAFEIVSRGAGAILGEVAFIEQGQRSATVTATTPLQVLVWNCADWRAICEADKTIGYQLVLGLSKILCARLREANVRILNEVSWGLV